MSNRSYHFRKTQGVIHVEYALTLLGAGAAAPTLGEGDPNGAFVTITRQGVGLYTLTTKDPFVALVSVHVQAVGVPLASVGLPVKNTNNTFSIPINVTATSGGVAADLVAAVPLYVALCMRNSTSKP